MFNPFKSFFTGVIIIFEAHRSDYIRGLYEHTLTIVIFTTIDAGSNFFEPLMSRKYHGDSERPSRGRAGAQLLHDLAAEIHRGGDMFFSWMSENVWMFSYLVYPQ